MKKILTILLAMICLNTFGQVKRIYMQIGSGGGGVLTIDNEDIDSLKNSTRRIDSVLNNTFLLDTVFVSFDTLEHMTLTGGGSNTSKMEFVVGTTLNAPSNGHDSIVNTGFNGKHLEVYRSDTSNSVVGLLLQYETNNDGWNLTGSTLTVDPPFHTGDRFVIYVTDTSAWNELSLADTGSGGSSTLGDELLYEGNFSSGAYWEQPNSAYASVTGGVLHVSGLAAWQSIAAQGNGQNSYYIPLTANHTYRVTYTISNYSSGGVYFNLGGTEDANIRSANGTYTVDIIVGASPGTQFRFIDSDTSCTLDIDNVSLREVLE